MNVPHRHSRVQPFLRVLTWLGGVGLATWVAAQETSVSRTVPPMPPPVRPPVELFRELLAAPLEKRDELLRSKTPAARELIARRLREHESLDPTARAEAESQLRLAQFRFYLSPLLRLSGAERAQRLAQAPAEDRALLEERLRAWDRLAPSARAALLESDDSLHLFVQQPGAERSRLDAALAKAPAAARADIERQFTRWSALSDAERASRTAAFQSLFGLTDGQRHRALNRMPEADRVAMEKTLERFARLPEAERVRCLAGFEKLSALSPSERDEFLRNAARWQAMSAEERVLWRRIVLRTSPPPLPPLPSKPSAGLVSTNR